MSKICYACRSEVAAMATQCPHCTAAIGVATGQAPQDDGAVLGLIVVAVLLYWIAWTVWWAVSTVLGWIF